MFESSLQQLYSSFCHSVGQSTNISLPVHSHPNRLKYAWRSSVCVCVLCVRSCQQAKRGCCSGHVRIVKRFFAKVGQKPKHSWYTVHVNWPIDRSRRGSRSGLWHPWWVHPSIGPQSHVCSTINSLSLVRTWSTVHKRHLMSSNALFKSADNELSELQHRNSATFCVLMDTGQMSNDSLFFAWRWLLLY